MASSHCFSPPSSFAPYIGCSGKSARNVKSSNVLRAQGRNSLPIFYSLIDDFARLYAPIMFAYLFFPITHLYSAPGLFSGLLLNGYLDTLFSYPNARLFTPLLQSEVSHCLFSCGQPGPFNCPSHYVSLIFAISSQFGNLVIFSVC